MITLHISTGGSFDSERIIISGNTSSASPGGLATSNNLRTFDNNNGIAIGGSAGTNAVSGLGLVLSETPSNGNHVILSDGSGSNLRLRAAGGDSGDCYVIILSDQAGNTESDVFTVAQFGGPLRNTELYHTGSLVFYTNMINGTGSVYISGSISGSGNMYLPNLPNTTTPNIVGFDTTTGQLTYYSTASFGGGGAPTDITALNNFTGSAQISITSLNNFTGSVATVNIVPLNNFTGSAQTSITALNSFSGSANTRIANLEAATGSYVTNAKTGSFLYSGSYDSSTSALTLYSLNGDYSLDLSGLAGGGGGFAITASNEGVDLTNNMSKINFVGNAVTATNVGSAVTVTIDTGSAVTTSTGSLMVTGSVNSNVLTFTKGDGSTFNLTVNTGSASVGTTNTGSLLVTGSVSNATITFTKGDGSTFPLTVNNVNNAVSASFASTASYVLNAVSASFAPNIYNSDGTVSTNRTVTIPASTALKFRATSAGSAVQIDLANGGETVITGLPTGVSSSLLAIDSVTGKVIAMTTSSIQNVVSSSYALTASFATGTLSASFAPNIYNSNGTLPDGTRRVIFGDSSILRFDLSSSIAGSPRIVYDTNTVTSGVRFAGTGYVQLDTSAVTMANIANTVQPNILGRDSLGNITYFSTASFVATPTNTGSLLVTGSVANSTLTFTKGNGSTFSLTVNNVANATTAGSVNSDSVYAEAGTDFDVWPVGSTFTLLDVNGTSIEAVAPKTAGDSSKLLAVATMEVYRGDTGTNFTAFQYRLFNSTQAAAIPGSTRDFSSYMLGSGEGAIPTTFTFTVPISNNVTSGDTIELQVRQSPSAALGIYSSASISYGDLALVSITD